MLKSKITHLLHETSKITGYSLPEVTSVISFCFKTMAEFFKMPKYPGIRMPYLGIIRTSSRALNYFIPNRVLPDYKEGKIDKEKFRLIWELRDKIRKDEKRRDYKERYGYEFKPDWRQDFDSVESD